jgi:hypothetical protein
MQPGDMDFPFIEEDDLADLASRAKTRSVPVLLMALPNMVLEVRAAVRRRVVF